MTLLQWSEWIFAASIVLCVVTSAWSIWTIRKARKYAQQIREDEES